jgi:ABC-2 type transport system permease protein
MNQSTSRLSAFLYLMGFSFRRVIQARQMAIVAVVLLLILTGVVGMFTKQFGWDRYNARLMQSDPANLMFLGGGVLAPDIATSDFMVNLRKETRPLAVFSRWIVFSLDLNFLMPLWSLTFATAAIGSDREGKSLIWFLTRPLPRWAIYLAKFLGVLPWCLLFNLGGFALLCLAGGEVGRTVLGLYWPAILAGSLAFTALYCLIGAVFSRPAVVGMLYAFFFETILSELPVPGTLKRLSINYYTRCILYGSAEVQDIPTESGVLFVPLSETTAWIVLVGSTIVLSLIGMFAFSRLEYRDDG